MTQIDLKLSRYPPAAFEPIEEVLELITSSLPVSKTILSDPKRGSSASEAGNQPLSPP
jgi:hypothetical protein